MNYQSTTGTLPPLRLGPGYLTWATFILPHLDQEPLYRQFAITNLTRTRRTPTAAATSAPWASSSARAAAAPTGPG